MRTGQQDKDALVVFTFEFGVIKDALLVTLDEDLESGVDEYLDRGWGQG